MSTNLKIDRLIEAVLDKAGMKESVWELKSGEIIPESQIVFQTGEGQYIIRVGQIEEEQFDTTVNYKLIDGNQNLLAIGRTAFSNYDDSFEHLSPQLMSCEICDGTCKGCPLKK